MRLNSPWLARILRATTLGLLVMVSTVADAQDQANNVGAVRWPGSDLYTAPSLSAPKLASLTRGEKVEFVKHDGLWSLVRWQNKDGIKEGWMSRIFIDWKSSASPSGAGAPASSATIAQAAPAIAPPTRSRGRAVLFGISRYQEGQNIPTLPGVPHDMNSASVMAQLMGISPDRITIYRDADASKVGITAILTQLAKDTTADEPVLVYYSGHGGRIADADLPTRCIEGLIAHDGALLTATEMAELLHPLAKLTSGLFVFFDSCHSGGLSATRAIGEQRLKPKFFARGDLSNCGEIVNMMSKPPGTRATGKPYVYAAAARANEVSLDDPDSGGLATSNFLRCMIDGNLKQTVDEISRCAQKNIDLNVPANSGFKPPHLSITGDLTTIPMSSDLSPAQRRKLVADVAQMTRGKSPTASKSANVGAKLDSQGWPRVMNPMQAFATILARADAATPLKVAAPETMQIDVDALRLEVHAPADGYLYLFQTGADGSSTVMLFPNLLDRNHQVRAGETLKLPRASWPLMAGGPEGESQLLVVFSRTERDIAQLVGTESGPFLDLAVSPTGMQALTLAVSRSAHADQAECRGKAKPNAVCDARYSASLTLIRETR